VASLTDRLNQFTGRTRLVVCRIFLHLSGDAIAPLLNVLNQAGQDAMDSEGDLQTVGEGLVEICTSLLRYQPNWVAAGNEGDVVWDEGEADDYVNQLFMDSAQRYLSGSEVSNQPQDTLSTMPVQNIVVMISVVGEGDIPALETDLAQMANLKQALTSLAGLHAQHKLRAVQVHFSPAIAGDVLTPDQILENFPELIPL
jgi:uncharacterized membrane protein